VSPCDSQSHALPICVAGDTNFIKRTKRDLRALTQQNIIQLENVSFGATDQPCKGFLKLHNKYEMTSGQTIVTPFLFNRKSFIRKTRVACASSELPINSVQFH
jgi:hypothetical protein